ncbi:PREDICTED: umecyanin-like [Tarenaya hassleriana]|uniref:umecyanin-like n=1 Tax=Tarenaya hassleriana TaxID=28532 RepID=UPI00053C6EEC|nr:PREDICTED: umecyanin-like [Tarenaya hassleriana]
MARIFEISIFCVAIFVAMAVAEDYDVGDDTEWTRPSTADFYTRWAAGKTFRLGDILEFEFREGMHDVAIVNKEGYDNCNKANPMTLFQKPPVKVTLNTTGTHYFICTVGDHCTVGQKLAVTIAGAGAPPAPVSGPTTPPGTTTNSSGAAGGESPPSGSAASIAGVGFFAAAMSVAIALLN